MTSESIGEVITGVVDTELPICELDEKTRHMGEEHNMILCGGIFVDEIDNIREQASLRAAELERDGRDTDKEYERD